MLLNQITPAAAERVPRAGYPLSDGVFPPVRTSGGAGTDGPVLTLAARVYASVFATADSRRDALWLPHDSTTVEENTLLPLILKESRNSGGPVFSSNLLHVKKGTLFAMTPNNLELGHQLDVSAAALMAGKPHRKGVRPLRELHSAINLRTASHMGLNIGYQQQRSFDYIFFGAMS